MMYSFKMFPTKKDHIFLDLAKKALREKDWKDVVVHSMLLAVE